MNRFFGFMVTAIFVSTGALQAEPTPKAKQTKQIKATPFVIKDPKTIATYAPPPDYPYYARAKRMTGAGEFIVYVRPNGTVSSVRIFKSTGHHELDGAAMTAFARWRFRPGILSVGKIPVRFSMRRP